MYKDNQIYLEPIPKIDRNIAHWFLYDSSNNWITTRRQNIIFEQLNILDDLYGWN